MWLYSYNQKQVNVLYTQNENVITVTLKEFIITAGNYQEFIKQPQIDTLSENAKINQNQ